MIVYDTARPYSVEYPERFAARILHIPRRNLGLPDDRIDRLSGTVIDTAEGTGALLVPFLATLVTSTHMYSAAVAGRLAGHVVDLFATLVAEHGPAGGPERTASTTRWRHGCARTSTSTSGTRGCRRGPSRRSTTSPSGICTAFSRRRASP